MKSKTMILMIALLLGLSFSGHAAEQPVHGLFLVQDRTEPLPGAPYTAEQFEEVGIKIVESVDELLSALNAEISWIATDWILKRGEDWYDRLAYSGRYIVEFIVHQKPYFWRWTQVVNDTINSDSGRLKDSNGEWIEFDELIKKTQYHESYNKWQEVLQFRENIVHLMTNIVNEESDYPITQKWDYLILPFTGFAEDLAREHYDDQDFAAMSEQELVQVGISLLTKRFKDLGERGWELVALNEWFFIFKRPIPVEVKK